MYTHNSFNYYGPLAQLVEQFPFKEWVDGSSPSGLTTINNYNFYALIGGYFIITSEIQFSKFSILFLLLG